MATPIDDELSQIGAALVAAGDGEPVELTDAQREVLARTAFPDMLDAILAHATLSPLPNYDYDQFQSAVDKIETAWSDELRAAFRLQSITVEITEDNSVETIQRMVAQDNRLSTAESQALLSALSPTADPHTRNSTRPSTARVYLASISVEGFRGIGPHADLPLEPQPGLTLVYGANGSGKSTFVEALDVLLTGSTARFTGRGREWRDAWANAHSPDRGQIDVEFVVEGRDTQHDTVTRDWTAADLSAAGSEKDNPLWAAVQTIGGLDVAGAIDEFRPILGYGELGPLFDESGSFDDPDSGYVTPFAQHIRTRASIQDGMADALWEFIQHPDRNDSSLGRVLRGWQDFLPYWRGESRGSAIGEILRSMTGDVTVQPAFQSPSGGNWQALVEYINTQNSRNENKGTEVVYALYLVSAFLDVARAYLPRFSNQIRESITQVAVLYASALEYYPEDSDDSRRQRGQQLREAFLTHTPRVQPYAEMLLDEIHGARLEQFSQRVSDIWGKIRHGSSDVHFEALSLQQHRPVNEGSRSTPEIRVSLGLTIDGDRPIERGALSQGELHSLALSVFLPTLMRPESPFGFAVIDDPVQAMDESAVDGLAEVLRGAAEELQVVVFTHDKRLIEALRNQDIDHTLINVTRGDHSRVECEPCYNPVTQRLFDARREEGRQRGQGRLSLTHIQDVTDHCRRAIEAACMRARRQALLSEGKTGVEIKNVMDNALAGRDITTRGLVALAIFGDFDRHGDVRDHVAEDDDKWGEWVDTTLRRVNDAVHAKTARKAREALGSDLGTLIKDVERLTQKIEENCNGPDHQDA